MANPPVGDDMLRANWVAKSNCRFYNFVIADWGWNPIFEGRLDSNVKLLGMDCTIDSIKRLDGHLYQERKYVSTKSQERVAA